MLKTLEIKETENRNDGIVTEKKLKSTMYLYGAHPKEFMNLPYKEALEYKLSSASTLLDNLLIPDYMNRDSDHIRKVYDAINFTTQLLNEIKDLSEE